MDVFVRTIWLHLRQAIREFAYIKIKWESSIAGNKGIFPLQNPGREWLGELLRDGCPKTRQSHELGVLENTVVAIRLVNRGGLGYCD